MKVTLGKAVRLPGRRLYRSGEVVEVSEQEAGFIARLGAEAATTAAVKPKPAVESAPAGGGEKVKDNKPEKPPKSASAARWKEYLTEVGINPSGLSKREMIAAVQ